MTDPNPADGEAKAASPDIPYRFDRTQQAAEIVDAWSALAPGEESGVTVGVAGRIMLSRPQGKLAFSELRDNSGSIQLFAGSAWSANFDEFVRLNLGDWVGATGEVVRTKRGELSVKVAEWVLLAEARRNFGDKWRGVTDTEMRYRQREVDLWANERSRQILQLRSDVVRHLRRRLWDQGFIEVETPVLHAVAGGATARPFVTRHNALDSDFYLRIAPELFLKRLVVGGFDKVFEIARVFRNEGLSPRHNPEFTMLELYEAQADYRRMMELAEQIIERSARAVNASTKVTFRGKGYDLKAPFPRRAYIELFREKNGFEFDDQARVRTRAQELALHDPGDPWKLMNDVFEATVEDSLEGPVMVVDYPVQISPLAKQKPGDARLAERFEVYVAGMELGNAFTELNDPAEQARRFEEQVASKDPEAPGVVDWDYVQALEYGMPPTGGLGIGIDRLVMVLTGQDSIRDVLLFPAMRPQHEHAHSADPARPQPH